MPKPRPIKEKLSTLYHDNPVHIANQVVFENVFMLLSIVLSATVMFSWYIEAVPILNIIPGRPTMKFNTALVFFLSGLQLTIIDKHARWCHVIRTNISVTIIVIGLLSAMEYWDWLTFSIDNIFIKDFITKQHPGRMSPGTALCAVLLGLGFIGFNSRRKAIDLLGRYSLKIALSIAFTAAIAFFLLIPSVNKPMFFQTMAIHTAFMFMGFSTLLLFKNPNSQFTKIVMGNWAGNRIIRRLLPIVVVFPVVASYGLISIIHKYSLSTDFGIIAFAVLFIPISVIYITFIAGDLNRADIERARLEENLKSRNRDLEQFKNGLDQVAIVAITNAKGVIKYVNKQFCEISQYSEEELIGNTHALINSGHHSREFFINMWKTITSGSIWADEIKNRAKDGSHYWVHTAIVPFKNDKGKIIEYLAIRQDITQRKEVEELLKSEFVQKLQYKNKELEQFAYVASHDLQEPLRTISSFTQVLAKKYRDSLDETTQRSMLFIQEATDRMGLLIKSLLDYSRLDKYEDLAEVNCNDIVSEVEEDLRMKIDETGAKLTIGKLPTIKGYRTPLRLLFQNLIANALKFQDKEKTPQINITAIKKRLYWEFAVKDNGIGIDDEHKEQIFIIFQRLHNKADYDGAGIGLAHCRKIVDLHSGNIWVDSKVGKGSTFQFTLPATPHIIK